MQKKPVYSRHHHLVGQDTRVDRGEPNLVPYISYYTVVMPGVFKTNSRCLIFLKGLGIMISTGNKTFLQDDQCCVLFGKRTMFVK